MRTRLVALSCLSLLVGCDGLYSPVDGGAGGIGGSGGSGGSGGGAAGGSGGGGGGGCDMGCQDAGAAGGGGAGGSGGGTAGGSGGGGAGGSGGAAGGGSTGGAGGGAAGGSGGSGGSGGGVVDAGPQAPVTALSIDWSFRGNYGEYSIGAAATPQVIVWIRYDTGITGKVTAINRMTKALITTTATDLGPYNVVSYGGQVALIGQGVQSNSDWHVHWIDPQGYPSTRSDTMNVVVAGGGVIGGAMYPEPDAGMAVHVVASASSSGTHVSAITNEDGGVTRTTHTCGNENWWDGATMDGTNRRYFIGNVFNAQCDLGNGNPVVPVPLSTRQWVVVRYAGTKGPGNAYVQPLGAAFKATGPAALGVSADSLWVAYYSTTSHLRVERLNPNNLSSMIADEATGQSFVTNTTDLGLSVADIVPHPTRDRVYVVASLYEPKSTWRAEVIPNFNQSTILIFTFEASTLKLLGVGMLPSTGIGKYASQMALIDDHLIVTGQCTATPVDGGVEPLCSPTPTPVGQDQSFIFSTPAP